MFDPNPLVTIFLTIIFYVVTCITLYQFSKFKLLPFLLLPLVPFATYAYSFWTATTESAEHRHILNSIGTTRITEPVPDILVIRGNVKPISLSKFAKRDVFRELYWETSYQHRGKVIKYTLEKNGRVTKTVQDELPEPPYLLILEAEKSHFWKDPRFKYPSALLGPYELRYVGKNKNELLALRDFPFIRYPEFPPVLTQIGWLPRNPNAALIEDIIPELLDTLPLKRKIGVIDALSH